MKKEELDKHIGHNGVHFNADALQKLMEANGHRGPNRKEWKDPNLYYKFALKKLNTLTFD